MYVLILVAEFRSYFDHVRSLRFDEKPDYDYLRRIFRELYHRKGFRADNIYDWDLLSLPEEERRKMLPEHTCGIDPIVEVGAGEDEPKQGTAQ